MRHHGLSADKSDFIRYFSYSRDGKQIAVSRGNSTSALMVSDEQK
ncbi:MAG: hypothetical protein ACXW18_05615 [Pyrinomonadaceae bacterium]